MPAYRFLLVAAPALAAALLVAGCGGVPRPNPVLEAARTAYLTASTDSLVAAKAPVALDQAGEALGRAEEAWRTKQDEAAVSHYAYLAQQRAHIAEQTARLNASREAVERAESERQRVLIEARAQEAEAARMTAEQERREAEAARQEAEAALARAQELSARVSDLEAQLTARGLVLTLGDVLFDVGQATLRPGAERTIDELTRFLQEYPERNVLIEGFTDNTGSEETNLTLSQRRTDAVRGALLARGIPEARIRTRGYGEAYPVASNDTAAGRQQNRRVEIVISDEEGQIPARQD